MERDRQEGDAPAPAATSDRPSGAGERPAAGARDRAAMPREPPAENQGSRRVRNLGLALGPVLAVGAWLLLPERFVDTAGQTVALGLAAHATAAVAAWMATWWLTEAVELSATALLPVALLPLLGGVPVGQVTAPYGHPLIFLFMGGFMLSLAMERWGLHRRVALLALRRVGSRPARLVLGFMVVTAGLSMWVSNTATVLVMLPVALSIVDFAETVEGGAGRLPTALLLGVAYAGSIGGLGTIIGSPPNGVLASYLEQRFGHTLSFLDWMSVGLPVVVLLLPATWLLLTRVLEPVGREPLPGVDRLVAAEYRQLGPPSRGEQLTLAVFIGAALMWILRPYLARLTLHGATPFSGFSDAGIAMVAAGLLFVVPVSWRARTFVIDWRTAVRLPWGVLILFGGGLSLARAIDTSHIGSYLGTAMAGLGSVPPWLLVVIVTAVVVFLTELTSNTATAATFVPVVSSVAVSLGLLPLRLALPVALGTSCAFMLPVATPPNAIVFGTGRVAMRSMVRAGLVLNFVALAIIVGVTFLLAGRLMPPAAP